MTWLRNLWRRLVGRPAVQRLPLPAPLMSDADARPTDEARFVCTMQGDVLLINGVPASDAQRDRYERWLAVHEQLVMLLCTDEAGAPPAEVVHRGRAFGGTFLFTPSAPEPLRGCSFKIEGTVSISLFPPQD